MKALALFASLIMISALAHASDNRIFKVDMNADWIERNVGQDEEKYFYSFANHENRAFVAYQVAKKKDRVYLRELEEGLLPQAREEVMSRGGEIQESDRYDSAGCVIDYLAYYKPSLQGTNVDFYMYCKGKLVTANYALRGMDSANIALAKKLHKSFRLK